MQQGNAHRLLDGRRHLVHGVGTEHQQLGTGPFQGLRRIRQQAPGLLPVAALLQALDLVEVDTQQHQPGRVQAAQARLHRLVEVAVVGDGRLPAHAADQADGFHPWCAPVACRSGHAAANAVAAVVTVAWRLPT
ncbi:hypothetical protein D3C84_964810 [compost metagenome]